ncbi:hypothetical protein ACLHDG_13820 [Sulfurovum sp. CS9]|uniref:hypothetical protein n=1 Tax=Sulfurovum sp. CS9 TaxID=3391146 RepID=UPI0039EAAE84
MNCIITNNKILLSTAKGSNKATTNGYEVTELTTPQQLMQVMNRKAVAIGLFSNGHRHGNYLQAMANVYFVDIDIAPATGEAPYYQTIEAKLKALNISFVSVPSKSADQYTYKRHIAIILDSYLPTGKKAFNKAAHYILNTVGIDVTKIDNRVAFNNVSFLAPANINRHFINYDDLSSFYDGVALNIPKHLKAVHDEVTALNNDIDSNQLVRFADGSTVPIFEAKKLIGIGENKSCYCPNPNHSDNNPSATFYHNSNGRVKIFCAVCGDVKINTNFIPLIPSITHDHYNYSIILNNAPQAKISTLIPKIGDYSYKTDTSVIWGYSVSNIGDIYQLLLAKVYLVQTGFEVLHQPTVKAHHNLLDTATLHPITKNVTLPTAYIPQGIQKSEHYYRYKQTATYVFNHYLFVEAAIYATYQNIIAPSRSFNDTCNLGLAYFDHVLQVMDKQKAFNQSNKTYPMKLQGKAKTKIIQQRVKNMSHGTQLKITARQKKVMQLLNDEKFLKFDGEPNLTAIAKKLGVTRKTLYADIEVIKTKQKAHTNDT